MSDFPEMEISAKAGRCAVVCFKGTGFLVYMGGEWDVGNVTGDGAREIGRDTWERPLGTVSARPTRQKQKACSWSTAERPDTCEVVAGLRA